MSSVSSASTNSGSSSHQPAAPIIDISVKYQKLASEYSKVRAQVSVLRKAVLEEQSKVAELNDAVKQRDHLIRKNEQETESLTFRNQQLTRRVTVLQEELDSAQIKARTKGKHRGNSSDVTTVSQPQFAIQNILSEELQQKIEENARLHHQIYESEDKYRIKISDLQSQVEELENVVAEHRKVVEEINTKNTTLVENFQEERDKLEVRLKEVETELRDSKCKTNKYEEQLQNCKRDLKPESCLNGVESNSTRSASTSTLQLDLKENGKSTSPSQTIRRSVLPPNNDFQDKIRKLEQSREHWMLEYNLLNVKYEKLQKKTQDLICSSGSDESPVNETTVANRNQQQLPVVTSILGKLTVLTSPSSDENTNDKGGIDELRSYLVSRINELVVHRQLAESKAATFHAELCSVHKRLAIAEQLKTKIEEELTTADSRVDEIKEELQTTTNNYKTQLSTMSDHLATMNERLTAQRDEIDDLKFALNNLAGNKKSKAK